MAAADTEDTDDTGPYQALYRRFRPQRFDEVLGQEHVSLALRNAVRTDKVGHAYLFSGPRGTGKTSTARILAKALNCAKPEDGEPCGICESCVEIARGTSLDVHELDAASNNGVDAMRDLVARAALGTPGRWKVYIIDEVHMLTAAASNALLKTLEEPPGHVVFVLATTDPQKVLPTIRSRTQHFEFRLLGPDVLQGLLQGVRTAAGIDVGDEALAAAVRRGRGSARDALSVLDQLAAAGVVDDEVEVLEEVVEALAERDAGRALVAVGHAVAAGRDIAGLTGGLVEHLRQAFLLTMAPELVGVAGAERDSLEDVARRLGLPAVVRAMEALGRSLVDMRDAPDPRVNLEATLIRLAHPEADDSTAALLERVDRLERTVAGRAVEPGVAPPVPTSAAAPAADAAVDDTSAGGPGMARKSLGAVRRQQPPAQPATRPEPATDAAPADPPAASGASFPSRDELVQAWGDTLLSQLSNRARARFRVGRFTDVQGDTALFALPNETHRSYCEEVRLDVEQSLAGHFGTPVRLQLVVDDEAGVPEPPRGNRRQPAAAPATPDPDDEALLDRGVLEAETEPAGAGLTPEQRLKQAFPGAEEL